MRAVIQFLPPEDLKVVISARPYPLCVEADISQAMATHHGPLPPRGMS